MSTNKQSCKRCGEVTPSYDFDIDTSFWGMIQTKTTTATERSVRFNATYLRHSAETGPNNMCVDEEQTLCDTCWGILVGRFMQGRSVPALPGKENR